MPLPTASRAAASEPVKASPRVDLHVDFLRGTQAYSGGIRGHHRASSSVRRSLCRSSGASERAGSRDRGRPYPDARAGSRRRQQLEFLANLQRLLSEGQFVATYKYAPLLAVADLGVELGDDSGRPLVICTSHIAEKFIQYYWQQTAPYPVKLEQRRSAEDPILRQNTGRQAAIIVLAHCSCNMQKGDKLAAVEHLHRWVDRNREQDEQLAEEFDRRKILHDRIASERVAGWAYSQAAGVQVSPGSRRITWSP